ncbi:hypothetical protein [Rhodococcus sp. YH3-3]|uniref:hypothetical protein n=1 Tax=Rhodococcus sp. YH3-3 TaxID=1803579 RepID=UPI000A700AD0|nr:hypothetical protein [Rhodococcus sp. YH3-3]
MKNALLRLRARVEDRVDLSSDRSSGLSPEAILILGSITAALGGIWSAIQFGQK